ncbi:MAG: HU family DNA-binding protein [Deltaproteobacteria bacterium]|nr:HU family DNA-binding protein [Deltaproteobacteria bacterium]
MKKADIIELMEKTLGDRAQARKAVDSLLEGIVQALKKGESVSLRDLGTFKCVQRKARKGINPRTGEKIKIKARKAVRFSSGTKLQRAVN